MTGSVRVARDTTSQSTHQVEMHIENFKGDVSTPTADSYHRGLGVSSPVKYLYCGSKKGQQDKNTA